MIFLIDHNLKGHALVFFGAIATQGWLDIVPMQFVTFAEMDLSINSDDRTVWRLAQENQMILLTANRSMEGKDSLEQVLREENTSESLPVITVGNAERLLNDSEYRGRCVESLVEIVLDIDTYRGARRIFIP
ncbi:MAG: ACP S-malonyltransferase [Microcystis sp. M54BS1]|uniref:ACP S-malonyltransferase n=1 Tax=unclassified Microcystis TaxID=2643300 RepID=UPI00257A95C0|nr:MULTISPECIES: ACP S-malonyltransferase [unclassified Microcystis]MCA2541025.1 ACP S-malonyltransferase [Microcystis sp. M54BS1]MCA2594453.1 ACP S-malonyltransferase [Microcystis sp. M38BS1]MCA2611474.1 ACP S-malonyltransferase [Microcystis sp. M27BS1]MCA2507272.1 ACP S-malonyltransferase [Microcystis sp. M62BS1]MCA2510183.1 ACP S-malonyltransferase [Microcystis sp. M60BS1]